MKPRRLTMTRWDGEPIRTGDLLRSTAGTVYLVHDVRPGRVNPFVLDVERLGERDAADLVADADAVVHEFQWNSRARRRP